MMIFSIYFSSAIYGMNSNPFFLNNLLFKYGLFKINKRRSTVMNDMVITRTEQTKYNYVLKAHLYVGCRMPLKNNALQCTHVAAGRSSSVTATNAAA